MAVSLLTLTFYLAYAMKKVYKEPEAAKKYSLIFENLKLKSIAALSQHIVFLTRRFLIITLVTACTMSLISQTLGYLMLTVVNFGYVLSVKPFDTSLLNISEVMNETIVFLASYHLLCFTDFVDSVDRENDVGWSLIVLIMVNILLNMAIFVYVVFGLTKLKCKRRIALKEAKKRAAIYQQAKLDAKNNPVPAKLKGPTQPLSQDQDGRIEVKLKSPLEPVQESVNESS